MQGREAPLYQRGKYRLGWDRKADGTLRTPFLAIFWYDQAGRRTRSASTGTASLDEAVIALDRRYLADRGEASAYCHACGQPLARGSAYLLTDAIADYRLEIGDARDSGDSIAGRLKHVSDFLVAGGLTAASCADACLPSFAEKFRSWSGSQPILFRNGDGVVTRSRPRAPATTEAALAQLAAVLNHGANERRSDARPQWKVLAPRKVNATRRTRTGVAVMADMLRYAAEANKRRGALHALLVGSLCTLARPSSIVGISTDAARRMWTPNAGEIALNPAGRRQNKKFRPTLPVMPLLEEWLVATRADADAERTAHRTGGWLVNYYGRPVQDVDSSWAAMLRELKLPQDREWKSYLLRHSLATLVRSRGVPKWELQAFMGHNDGSQTETYAIETLFPNVLSALAAIQDELDTLAPGALHRTRAGPVSNIIQLRRCDMPSG